MENSNSKVKCMRKTTSDLFQYLWKFKMSQSKAITHCTLHTWTTSDL